MSEEKSLEFAATTIGTMLLMLQKKGYSDAEIVKMLGKEKVREILKVLRAMP